LPAYRPLLQPIPCCGSTNPRHTTKPSKIRDVRAKKIPNRIGIIAYLFNILHGRSTERNPKLVFGSPNHTTWSARTSAVKRESKRIWDTDRRWHVYACAHVRQIEDGAVEDRRVIIQNDLSALQCARALNASFILHGSLLHSGARCDGPVTLLLQWYGFVWGKLQRFVKDTYCLAPPFPFQNP
jgi:hypothetical protein